MNYADKLRAFADYLDSHTTIADENNGRYDYPALYLYAKDWDDFQYIIRGLDGFDKGGDNGNLRARHEEKTLDDETIFFVSVSVSGVCEAKPKVDEEGNPVMRPKMQYVPTGEMEQEMEYDCPQVWTQ